MREELVNGRETTGGYKIILGTFECGIDHGVWEKNSYEALICELSQVKQGIVEKMKDYTDRLQGLSVTITRSLSAQGHNADNPIFEMIKALVVKHFMIGLLPELLQQVKYKGVDTLEEVIRIAKKKEASLETTPI